MFQEGLIDSDNAEEFWLRMAEVGKKWKKQMGIRGENIHLWIAKHKADEMVDSMLRPVRIRAGLGNPAPQFTTNRVECINHLLSDEANGRPHNLPQFAKTALGLVE